MKTDKTFYLQNLKTFVAQMEQLGRTFKNETDQLGHEWKDSRKNEFFIKHVFSRQDDINKAALDMQTIAQKLKTIDDGLKNFVK
jgi:hypothetical protein